MGMDVVGMRPRGQAGESFSISNTAWGPLWSYCTDVRPEITSKVENAFSNDGRGLGQDDAEALAAALREEIESGRTSGFAALVADAHGIVVLDDAAVQHLTSFLLEYVGGTEDQAEACVAATQPAVVFRVDIVNAFAAFLEACGGFAIW